MVCASHGAGATLSGWYPFWLISCQPVGHRALLNPSKGVNSLVRSLLERQGAECTVCHYHSQGNIFHHGGVTTAKGEVTPGTNAIQSNTDIMKSGVTCVLWQAGAFEVREKPRNWTDDIRKVSEGIWIGWHVINLLWSMLTLMEHVNPSSLG